MTGAFELKMTKNQYRYLKDTVRVAEQTEVSPLFVPEWMPRQRALEANRELIKAAYDLQDVMTEKVIDLCSRFPGASFKWVLQELINLAGSTPFPRTVWKGLKTSNLAGRLYDAFGGYETSRCSRIDPPELHHEFNTTDEQHAPV